VLDTNPIGSSTDLLLTRLVSSILAIESRTPAHSPAAVAYAITHLHLHLLSRCCI